MMLASAVSAVAPAAFVAGAFIGFVVGARYRIQKRNGHDDEPH